MRLFQQSNHEEHGLIRHIKSRRNVILRYGSSTGSVIMCFFYNETSHTQNNCTKISTRPKAQKLGMM